jgi:hypothetical protein
MATNYFEVAAGTFVCVTAGSQPCERIHTAASFGQSAVWPNFGSSPDPCVPFS